MPALTSVQLMQAVADSLQVASVGVLSPRWGRLCDMAADDALRDIYDSFIGRGYTQDQVDSWPRLASLHRLQGLYWAFVHGAGLHSFDDRWVNKLDQRGAMKDMAITESGGFITGTGDVAIVEFGRLTTTGDKWTRDTPL